MTKRSNKKYFLISFLIIILTIGVWLIWFQPFNNSNEKSNFNLFNTKKEETKPFSFAIAGDNHNDIELYDELIQKVNQGNNSFFVDLGDTTRVGGASEYAQTQSVLNNLKIPYHMVIGNHDTIDNGQEIWQTYFGLTYYSWDLQNSHFVVLDDVTDPNAFSEKELSWLENDLSKTNKKLKIVFLHTPPRCPTVPSAELGFTGPKSEERINQFFSISNKYKINKIYAGHIHNLLNYTVSGIPITVTGGAGGPIYQIPFIGKDQYHYLEIEATGSDIGQKVVNL